MITEDDLTDISPEAHAFVKKRFLEFPKMNSRFEPPSEQGTLLFGYNGGAEWGGNAIDPDGILYQNVNIAPWELIMVNKEDRDQELISLSPGKALYRRDCAACHGEDRKGKGIVIPGLLDLGKKLSAEEIDHFIKTENGRMPSFPYLSADNRKAIIDFLLDREVVPPKIPKGNHDNVTGTSKRQDFPYVPDMSPVSGCASQTRMAIVP